MENTLTHLAFLAAAGLSLALTITLWHTRKSRALHPSIAVATGIQSLWLFTLAYWYAPGSWPSNLWVSSLECLHYSAWLLTFARIIPFYCERPLPTLYRFFILGLSLIFVFANGINVLWPQSLAFSPRPLMVWQGLVLSIGCLVTIEQLYRNITSVRLLKLMALNLAAMFIYDIYLYAQDLIFDNASNFFAQVRATVTIAACTFMMLATLVLKHQNAQPPQLVLSRPIAFYSTSLIIAGTLLSAISFAGYYMSLYGGDWGTIIYSLLLVGTLILLASAFSSSRLRERLSVLVNKHLFSHKYDYRTEWLNVIDQLSKPSNSDEVHQRALSSVTNIFKSAAGGLWLKRGNAFVPAYQAPHLIVSKQAQEPSDSVFIRALEREEWVFFPQLGGISQNQSNERLPDWAHEIQNIWLILPLIDKAELIGFMVLIAPAQNQETLNWEDLDLLKILGRQVAHYLSRQAQADQLAEARQFEAFNRLSAYMMHDLKNLIAQQSLVVKNAAKHKDNPAFVEDAIQTISNSVNRMQHLLQKLQHTSVEEIRVLLLSEVLMDAVKRCQKAMPAPTLRIDDGNLQVKADRESLTMVFAHMIQNAQDATLASGYVDLFITRQDGFAVVLIEDNGQGMDEEFIQNRLFRPFDTTKTGKGMGIGMYQARDCIANLGGEISVESVLGEGTTFFIRLPLAQESTMVLAKPAAA
ncbi:MAG TPA: XrtA/PEP-CTERM system histidine kinase PrsK [Cellvibrionaceae bacterium]